MRGEDIYQLTRPIPERLVGEAVMAALHQWVQTQGGRDD